MTTASTRYMIWIFEALAVMLLTAPRTLGQPVDGASPRSYADWSKQLDACFDPQRVVDDGLLRRFVEAAEASRTDHTGAEKSQGEAPGSLLADAYMQQGRYEDARRLLVELPASATESGGIQPTQHQAGYRTWRAGSLAAINVMQRHYGAGICAYLAWVGYRVRLTSLPPMLLSALLIVLWRMKTGAKAFAAHRGRTRIILMCCIPLFVYAVFDAVVWPINSLVTYGSSVAFLVDHRCGYIVVSLYRIELPAALLAAAYFISGKHWPISERGYAIQPAKEMLPVVVTGSSSFNSIRAIGLLVVGTILAMGTRLGVSTSFWHAHYAKLSDVWWVLSAVSTLVVAPICEEAFFRGTLYRISRDAMDPVFGAIASAIVFAGYHLDVSLFPELFWSGIVFAVLYEIKKSVWLPVFTHCVNNLLANW